MLPPKEAMAEKTRQLTLSRWLARQGSDFLVKLQLPVALTVYWEHCGMLLDDEYRRRWELKKKWYRDHGVLPWQDSGGPEGTLVETSDDPATGFDCQMIASIADAIFGKA
jgi:hypothetical protein